MKAFSVITSLLALAGYTSAAPLTPFGNCGTDADCADNEWCTTIIGATSPNHKMCRPLPDSDPESLQKIANMDFDNLPINQKRSLCYGDIHCGVGEVCVYNFAAVAGGMGGICAPKQE